MLRVYRSHPTFIKAGSMTIERDEQGPLPYSGNYSLGFALDDKTPPATELLRPGPVLSTDAPLGRWMVWCAVDDNPEHPITPLGYVEVVE